MKESIEMASKNVQTTSETSTEASMLNESNADQGKALGWVNGDERPWKEIIDESEKRGWTVDMETLLAQGWRVLNSEDGIVGRDDDGRRFLMVIPSNLFIDHLQEKIPDFTIDEGFYAIDEIVDRYTSEWLGRRLAE